MEKPLGQTHRESSSDLDDALFLYRLAYFLCLPLVFFIFFHSWLMLPSSFNFSPIYRLSFSLVFRISRSFLSVPSPGCLYLFASPCFPCLSFSLPCSGYLVLSFPFHGFPLFSIFLMFLLCLHICFALLRPAFLLLSSVFLLLRVSFSFAFLSFLDSRHAVFPRPGFH